MDDDQQQPPPEAKPLPDSPLDGITALSYLSNSSSPSSSASLLASTSWDGTVRVHDTKAQQSVLSHSFGSGPLLSLATTPSSPDTLITGGLDGSIRLLDIPTTKPLLIGRYQDENNNRNNAALSKLGCSCLAMLDDNLVASAGWSKEFCLWDIRQQTATTTPSSDTTTESNNSSTFAKPVLSLTLPGKAFGMDVDTNNNRFLVATSGRRNVIIDVRGTNNNNDATNTTADIALDRESSLKFQTRCVKFIPDGTGFALGSVEGRVGVEFLDELGISSPMKKYAFKCHRIQDTVYPVNCIQYHPKFQQCFATGGCDGTVVLWDGQHKKKLTSLPPFPTSISALAFNHDGTELAIASSYTHEEGDREHPKDEIYIRKILDSECLPKPK